MTGKTIIIMMTVFAVSSYSFDFLFSRWYWYGRKYSFCLDTRVWRTLKIVFRNSRLN